MRGVEVELGGKLRTLRYDWNALADIEERAGASVGSLLSEGRAGPHAVRLILWGGLKHADHGLTVQRVGQMIQDYIEGGGDLTALVLRMQEAINASGLGNSEAEAAIQ